MALMQELDAKVNDYMNREWADAKAFDKHMGESEPYRCWEILTDMVQVLIDFDVILEATSYLSPHQ